MAFTWEIVIFLEVCSFAAYPAGCRYIFGRSFMCAIYWSIIDMIKDWIPEYNNSDEIAIKSVRQECNIRLPEINYS